MTDRLNHPNGRPKVLVISAVWPHFEGCAQAAEAATFEIVHRLVYEQGFDVVYALVSESDPKLTPAAAKAKADLEARGLRFTEPVRLDAFPPPAGRTEYWVQTLLRRNSRHLLRGYGQSDKVLAALEAMGDWRPDAVIPVWTFEGTGAAVGLPGKIFAFYGNPDHKLVEAHLMVEWRWERSWSPKWLIRHLLDHYRMRCVEWAHLRMLQRFAVIWENAKNDVDYYHAKGLTNVRYLRNMWPIADMPNWQERRDALEQTDPVKICGNIGHLSATGNTFGLAAIGEEILPALRRRLGNGKFEMHICGRMQPRSFIRPLLENQPDVFIRGFIDDIDKLILSCPIFLMANNRYNFKVGHTRILHAFALGGCVVAFRDTRLAMPELVHDENILLADDGDGIAEQIERAAKDKVLRRRIGANAIETLKTLFNPEDALAEMARDLRDRLGVEPLEH